jgi:two-component system, chemotaxis family, protein-glutamate methylesterase/glutaminase
MIRVVLAEDSDTCRALLTAVLESDSQLRIVGQAHDGEAALALTEKLRPDVVVMDAYMPVMDGFSATRNIMLRCPTPIVIVSASMNVAHVATSMRALAAGALTLLPKPVSPTAEGFDELAQQFVRTVRAMADVKVVRRFHHGHGAPGAAATRSSHPPLPLHASHDHRPRPRVIGIGASTGGPAALQRVLSDLPADVPVPIVVVQHIARGFVEGLAGWLDAVTPPKVRVATHGEALQPGTVYIAPDDQQLVVTRRGTVDLSRRAAVGGFLPSCSVLFSSLGESYGPSALGVIMTGMGQDGIDGLRELRAAGAMVIAQDEETSVVFGMPAAAISAGLVDTVLPLPLIGARLFQLVRNSPSGGPP